MKEVIDDYIEKKLDEHYKVLMACPGTLSEALQEIQSFKEGMYFALINLALQEDSAKSMLAIGGYIQELKSEYAYWLADIYAHRDMEKASLREMQNYIHGRHEEWTDNIQIQRLA